MQTVSLAYQFVAVAVMLAEINYCCSKLDMDIELPITEKAIRKAAVFHPDIIGFAGNVYTERFAFDFSRSGRLRFITKLQKRSRIEYLDTLVGVKSVIDTNDAYRIATNWLVGMEIDLEKLEKERPPTVRQQLFLTKAGATVDLPIFHIKWGDWHRSAVEATVSGENRTLISLRQDVISYSKRPASLITNVAELLAITDAEFRGYSAAQRSNLVARFAAVDYSQNKAPPDQIGTSSPTNSTVKAPSGD